MSGRGALSHTQYVLINRLATPAGAFLILILIAWRSDVLLGEYALVMTYYYIMQMLPLLGLTPYVMREVARRPEEAGKYFVTIGAMSLLGCIAVDGLIWGFMHFTEYSASVREGIAVTGVLIFPGILLFIAEIIFMSLHQARPVAQVALWENLVRVLLSLAALYLDTGLAGLIWVFFLTRLGALLVYVHILRQMGILSGPLMPDAALWRATLGVLPGFFLGTLLFVVFSRMDFVVLSLYLPVEQIGYYAIAYRLFDLGLVVLTALIMAAFPSIARKFAGARHHYRVAVRDMILFVVAALLVVAFAGALLGEYYVALFFAKQYPHPVLLTQLFLAALFICGVEFFLSSILHASDRQMQDTQASAVGGGANLMLLFGLIPVLGIFGAYLAKVGSTLVQGLIKAVLVKRIIGLNWRGRDSLALAVVILPLVILGGLALSAPLVLKLFLILLAGAVYVPGAFVLTGLFHPLRLLRYYWHPRHAPDVAGLGDLLDVIVADARPCRRPAVRRAALALMATRLARHFYLRQQGKPAQMLVRLAAWLALPDQCLPSLADPMPAPVLRRKSSSHAVCPA
ncbi:MAG: oligosaccharide flippase family protein [Pseudomonadota bacterium]